MEQLLLKMAHQLDTLDEASLTALWEKYAHIVNRFEPSERWQEAALVLSFIQAKRWKNQLFNTKWASRTRLALQNNTLEKPQVRFTLESAAPSEARPRAKVLPFDSSCNADAQD